MRKQYKKKKKSCALCKPWKMKWQKRWKYKELQNQKELQEIKKDLF